MYGKVFSQIYDSTLAAKGPWEVMALWPHMICLADKDGNVDMPAEILARRTTFPLEVVLRGLEALSAPDPASRSKECEGRRIVLIDPDRPWGWHLVNYQHYAKIRSQEERREYFRLNKQLARAKSTSVDGGVDNVDIVDKCGQSTDVHNVTHVDVDIKPKPTVRISSALQTFERFWKTYPAGPRKVAKVACLKKWNAIVVSDVMAQEIIEHVMAMKKTQQWVDYCPAPLTYLNQRRWVDEIQPDKAPSRDRAKEFI